MTNQEAIDIIKTAIAEVEWEYPMDYAAAFDMAVNALEGQDDPDRVKAVRCRDCRFWESENAEEGDSYGRCRNDYGACQNQQTDMNWFCADGEREG
jgi:hypothetical protein